MRAPKERFDFVHDFLSRVFGDELHAKRILSLTNGTLGVMTGAALAVSPDWTGFGDGAWIDRQVGDQTGRRGAAVGALHSPGCDVERCPRCGDQAISCGCTYGSSKRMPWTGMWPGEEEARKFGWFAKSVPGTGWVPCAADDPEAHPDLNRLFTDARWDADSRQWVLK